MKKTIAAIAGTLMALGLMQTQQPMPRRLRLAIGQRGNWDTSVSELGQRAASSRSTASN